MTQRMDTEPGIQLGPAQLANLVDLTSELIAILAVLVFIGALALPAILRSRESASEFWTAGSTA